MAILPTTNKDASWQAKLDHEASFCNFSRGVRMNGGESLFCGKATAVAICPRHIAKSRLSTPLSSSDEKEGHPMRGGLLFV